MGNPHANQAETGKKSTGRILTPGIPLPPHDPTSSSFILAADPRSRTISRITKVSGMFTFLLPPLQRFV